MKTLFWLVLIGVVLWFFLSRSRTKPRLPGRRRSRFLNYDGGEGGDGDGGDGGGDGSG